LGIASDAKFLKGLEIPSVIVEDTAVKVHLLRISNINILVLEYTSENVSILTETAYIVKFALFNFIHASLLVSTNFLCVELVNTLRIATKDKHLNSVLSYTYTRRACVKRGICDI